MYKLNGAFDEDEDWRRLWRRRALYGRRRLEELEDFRRNRESGAVGGAAVMLGVSDGAVSGSGSSSGDMMRWRPAVRSRDDRRWRRGVESSESAGCERKCMVCE